MVTSKLMTKNLQLHPKFSIFLPFRFSQGHKWLPKIGGVSSNTGSNAARLRHRRAFYSAKKCGGGYNCPPSPPSLTPLSQHMIMNDIMFIFL